MWDHDVKLDVLHNGFFDGKGRPGEKMLFYLEFWRERKGFPEAREQCDRYVKDNG